MKGKNWGWSITYSIYTFWTAWVYQVDPPVTVGGLYVMRAFGTFGALMAITCILTIILEKKDGSKKVR